VTTVAIVGNHEGIRLSDGRLVTFASAGPDDGFPVIYCHGAVGSPRWRTVELDALVQRLGIRYLIINRPGFGGSDPSPGRCVLDFAHDLAELMDRLGLSRFAVVGVSAGAPYAIACGWALADRVAALAVVSPLGPPDGAGSSPSLRYRVPLVAFGPHRSGSLLAGLCLRSLGLSSDTAPAAMIDDYVVCRRSWGFDPSEVRIPLTVWHGRDDRLVPLRHTIRLAAAISTSTPRIEPAAGHFFYRRHLGEIITTLVALRETAASSPRYMAAA
jgi:pimeloyl-ACP methyl ester carboxylesterase